MVSEIAINNTNKRLRFVLRIGSLELLGDLFMTFLFTDSKAKAIEGSESSIILIHNICTGTRGNGIPNTIAKLIKITSVKELDKR